MLIEPRPVVCAQLRLEPVVPLVDEVQDRLLAHQGEGVRVGAARPPGSPGDAAEQRGEDVLRIEARRDRRAVREVERVYR